MSTDGVDLAAAGAKPLPTGVVTFLLTDIVGSTELFRRVGEDRYRDLLATHHRLIRSALDEYGGVEVGREGDSVLAAFSAPSDGVLAALGAQQLLGAHTWPADAKVAVRMGLHIGAAQVTDERTYVSYALHQVSRVVAAARGGQILATRAMSDLGELPGTLLRPVGSYWLKDFPEPVPLVAVVPPDDMSEPDPPRAPRADLSNLPTLRGLFLGRESEFADLDELLVHPELLTIIGPGGVGKTRLALELAAKTAEGGDEAWVVELAGVTTRGSRDSTGDGDPEGATVNAVVGAIARTLGTDAGTPEDLAHQLSTSTMLLVIDNAEHLLDAVAEVVDLLLARCPRLRVLVTSRQPLAVDAENLRRLEPLETPDAEAGPEQAEATAAVTLFAARARAADPDFRLTADNRDEVFELCRLLDGLPLALELAAARIGILPPKSLVERVRSVGDLPGLTGRARPNRHATLHAVLDWSLSLCSEVELSVLRRMAAFAGPVDLDAIATVTGGQSLSRDAVVDAIAGLVDKSLVAVRRTGPNSSDKTQTYDMLVTVRQAALSRLLAEDERDEAVARHASWVLDRVREAAPLGLERDGAMVRAIALEIELALERGAASEIPLETYTALFLGLRDHFYSREQHLGIRHGLHLAEQDIGPVARAHCLYMASKAMLELLHPAFVSTTHAALDLARAAGDPEVLGRCLLAIAEIELLTEPRLSVEAFAALEESILWLEQAAETSARSKLHLLLAHGFLALDAQDYATATEWYTKCLDLTVLHGAEFSEAVAHFNLAESAELAGDYDRAVAAYRLAGETSIRLGGFISATDALMRAAIRLTAVGDPASAVECGAEAVLCARRARSEPLLHSALEVYADAAAKAGDYQGAQHARNEAAALKAVPNQTARAL